MFWKKLVTQYPQRWFDEKQLSYRPQIFLKVCHNLKMHGQTIYQNKYIINISFRIVFIRPKVKVHDCSPSLHNEDVTPTYMCLPINKGCCLKWWHGDCCFHYINVCVIVCVDYVAAFFVASVPPLLKWEPVCLDHLKKSLFSIKCCYIWYVYLICDPSLATLVFVILCVWFTCSISIIDNGGFSIVIKICERRVSISNGSICDSLCPLLTI